MIFAVCAHIDREITLREGGKVETKKERWAFPAALAAGVVLHFLYEWLPGWGTAIFSPVNESLWEHMKIVFWPLAGAAFCLSGRDRAQRAARLLSAVLVSLAMLAAAYAYHILLGGRALAFDLALYAAAMLAGFLLPRAVRRLGQSVGGRAAIWVLVLGFAAALVWCAFFPPDGILSRDLSEAETFLRG